MKLTLLSLAALATLAACGSLPESNLALDHVRARHATVRSDAAVTTLAADELGRADAALRLAESAHADRADGVEVDHLAYLANQRLTIAEETAASRTAQAVTDGAAGERERLRLTLRTAEADTAQRELALAGQAAEADRARLASTTAEVDSLARQLKTLRARPTDRGMVVTLGDLLFDSGASRMRAGGDRSLAQLADFMNRYPERRASIEGYTDSIGTASSNLDLSDRRAQSVLAALVDRGVDAERLRARGYGEQRPVSSNDSAAGRQMNRRVEVIFAPAADDPPAQ